MICDVNIPQARKLGLDYQIDRVVLKFVVYSQDDSICRHVLLLKMFKFENLESEREEKLLTALSM